MQGVYFLSHQNISYEQVSNVLGKIARNEEARKHRMERLTGLDAC